MARYTYDPFGNVLSMNGPLAGANRYQSSSKEVHPNSGLVYYQYRFYDANLQRWLNRDPLGDLGSLVHQTAPLLPDVDALGGGGMDDQELLAVWATVNRNLYTGPGNNPVNGVDPDGLFLVNIGLGLLGGAADLGLQLLVNGGRWDCVSWTGVGISAVASASGAGVASTLSKLGKLGRAARVLEKAASKRVPLSNYWKEQVAAARAARKAAAGAAAGLAAAEAAKYAARDAKRESVNNPPPGGQPGPNGKPPCP